MYIYIYIYIRMYPLHTHLIKAPWKTYVLIASTSQPKPRMYMC